MGVLKERPPPPTTYTPSVRTGRGGAPHRAMAARPRGHILVRGPEAAACSRVHVGGCVGVEERGAPQRVRVRGSVEESRRSRLRAGGHPASARDHDGGRDPHVLLVAVLVVVVILVLLVVVVLLIMMMPVVRCSVVGLVAPGRSLAGLKKRRGPGPRSA